MLDLALDVSSAPRTTGSRQGIHCLYLPFTAHWAVKLFASRERRDSNRQAQQLAATIDRGPPLGPSLETERDGLLHFGYITAIADMVRWQPQDVELRQLRRDLDEIGIIAQDLWPKNLARSPAGKLWLVDFSVCGFREGSPCSATMTSSG